MRIFLSYRRDDSSAHAGRLHDALVHEFGPSSVFQDVVAIGAGEDFTEAIDRALDDCDAALVVIGPTWLAPVGPGGMARLYQPDDYVRIEVAEALTRDMRVVPILVGGAAMPTEAELPEHLRTLAKRQAVVLRDETWHNDVAGLIRSLRGESQLPTGTRRRNPWLLVGVAAIVVVAALIGVGLLMASGDDDGSGEAAPPPCSVDPDAWTTVDVAEPAAGEVRTSNGGTLRFEVTGAQFLEQPDGTTWEVVLDTIMTNESTTDQESHGYWQYDQLVVDGFVSEAVSCSFVDIEAVDPGQRGRGEIGFVVADDPSGSLTLVVDESGSLASIVIAP